MEDAVIDPSLKRKRQPSFSETRKETAASPVRNGVSPLPQQAQATQSDLQQRPHLQVNYLARQYSTDLPLITYNDTCPSLIALLNDYNGVFDRHESMASNLGAHSTGTEWVRRFERMFDAPPRIVSHAPGYQPNVTWLDIVDFASTLPDHFNLSSAEQEPRFCEIHIKDCDVVISEQDFRAIKSGGLQNMIPTQPVAEDEEKELGTLQILERSVNEVVHFADKVALRGRVFVRRLGERKAAIIERRAADVAQRVNGSTMNGAVASDPPDSNTDPGLTDIPPNPAVVSPAIHAELTQAFTTSASQHTRTPSSLLYSSVITRPIDPQYAAASPGLHTPEHVQPPRAHRPLAQPGTEHDGLFKATMLARTEAVARGGRIYPPCDRCRRLRTDCIKNLTACAGCTKKHAKCSWRDVKAEELSGAVPPPLGTVSDSGTWASVTGPGSARNASRVSSQMLYSFNGKQHAPMPESGLYDVYPTANQPGQQVYEPAYDPAFDEPDPGVQDGLHGDADHDERDADQARIQAAARSLAMAAMHSHLADSGATSSRLEEDISGEQQDASRHSQAPQAQMTMDHESGGDDALRLQHALQSLKDEPGEV